VLDLDGMSALVAELLRQRYVVFGPTVRDGAIVLAELASASELPYGWTVRTEAGQYRLEPRADGAAFAHSAGPQSWKSVLHPARARLWSSDREGEAVTVTGESPPDVRYAFLGVRPCDLRAIATLDHVLVGGPHVDTGYLGRRRDLFIIAVECTEPGATCFCTSMGAGPGTDANVDLVLVERVDTSGHRFVVRADTPAGADLLTRIPRASATEAHVADAVAAVSAAADRMGREMPSVDLRRLLADSHESPRWDDVAARCLTCGNCTMVCPTCFCSTTQDVTDLTGDHAERWRVWDSCFALDFTFMHGGDVRSSGQSRYRQWITHKLSTWYDQFGSSGCVGCGRCLVWCPVGIDITEEAAALAELRDGGRSAGGDASG
jgi:ferredoxin